LHCGGWGKKGKKTNEGLGRDKKLEKMNSQPAVSPNPNEKRKKER